MKPLGILCTLLAAVPTVQGRGSRDASALQAMEDLAAGRPGVVCWQSRRTGPVRIFCCDLDGANLRQVSPDVPSRDHLAPLISPDGTRVLYYETMTLSDSNYYADHTGDMMIVDASDTDGLHRRRSPRLCLLPLAGFHLQDLRLPLPGVRRPAQPPAHPRGRRREPGVHHQRPWTQRHPDRGAGL
jgi:hypothetical protein